MVRAEREGNVRGCQDQARGPRGLARQQGDRSLQWRAPTCEFQLLEQDRLGGGFLERRSLEAALGSSNLRKGHQMLERFILAQKEEGERNTRSTAGSESSDSAAPPTDRYRSTEVPQVEAPTFEPPSPGPAPQGSAVAPSAAAPSVAVPSAAAPAPPATPAVDQSAILQAIEYSIDQLGSRLGTVEANTQRTHTSLTHGFSRVEQAVAQEGATTRREVTDVGAELTARIDRAESNLAAGITAQGAATLQAIQAQATAQAAQGTATLQAIQAQSTVQAAQSTAQGTATLQAIQGSTEGILKGMMALMMQGMGQVPMPPAAEQLPVPTPVPPPAPTPVVASSTESPPDASEPAPPPAMPAPDPTPALDPLASAPDPEVDEPKSASVPSPVSRVFSMATPPSLQAKARHLRSRMGFHVLKRWHSFAAASAPLGTEQPAAEEPMPVPLPSAREKAGRRKGSRPHGRAMMLQLLAG